MPVTIPSKLCGWIQIDPDKKFYQGVLQIAVACYHLHNRNWRGAVTLLGEGIGRLPYYQPVYAGIDVTQLIEDSRNLLNTLQSIGTEGVSMILSIDWLKILVFYPGFISPKRILSDEFRSPQTHRLLRVQS